MTKKITKLMLNGQEYKIREYQAGWQPGANTLIYYPLTSDLVDVMGNGNTGTVTGNVTFNANSGSTTGVYVSGQNSIYVTGMSLGVNNKNTVTLNYWANFVSFVNYCALVGHNDPYDSAEITKLVADAGYQALGCKGSGGNFYMENTGVSLNSGYHNFCFTLDNGTLKMYLDGTQVNFQRNGSGSYTSYNAGTLNNGTSELQLGWGGGYGSDRTATGYVRAYIVEAVPRTAQEISDYFNLTKGKYGIS